MRLFTVDVYEDRSKPKFQVYFVRSESAENAKAAVKKKLVNPNRIEAQEVGPDHQGIHADLEADTPLYFTEFEATWIRSV